MISLSVSRGGRGVGVGRQVMELCGSIVRALWHGVPPAILDAGCWGKCSLPDPLTNLVISFAVSGTEEIRLQRGVGLHNATFLNLRAATMTSRP
jgi:hypothetical protein